MLQYNKMTFMKKLLVLFFLVALLFVKPQRTFADDNFAVTYHIAYAIQQSGTAHVTINGSLTNKKTQVYATSYAILLGFKNVANIQASDPKGLILPKVDHEQSSYKITLPFNSKVVGVDKTMHFTVAFDTDDIAKQEKNVW